MIKPMMFGIPESDIKVVSPIQAYIYIKNADESYATKCDDL